MSVSAEEDAAFIEVVSKYMDEAAAAADSEEYAKAAEMWEKIFTDDDMVSLFSEDQLAEIRSRVDWARGFESANSRAYSAAAERWQKVIDAGGLGDWYGSTGEHDLTYNLALAHALADQPDKAKAAMGTILSAEEQAEILGEDAED